MKQFLKKHYIPLLAVVIYYVISYVYFGKIGLQMPIIRAVSYVVTLTVFMLIMNDLIISFYQWNIKRLDRKIRKLYVDIYVMGSIDGEEETSLGAIDQWKTVCPGKHDGCELKRDCPFCTDEWGWRMILERRYGKGLYDGLMNKEEE